MSLAFGTKLGPYEIIAPLGAGGMGEVYRARDTRLGREVALKVLPESFSRDADRLRRFEQEARAVAALSHPNILAIHDIGEQDGSPFIVSELLEGSSLRSDLDHGPLPPRKASDYAAQIAQGLAAAHDKGIIHRDLKPENVFITRDGRVKILDFGLAKLAPARDAKRDSAESDGLTLTSSPTEAGMVMGTAGYMAPEQVRGAAIDSRTDIFAFGAVLYEMLSGNRAFRRDTAAETMTAILKEEPPELSEMDHPVSPGLERIVRRCLEKQPEQRFQSAKDLAFALEALTGTTSKTAANAAIAVGAERPRWLVFVVAAAIVGIAIGAAVTWFLRPAPALPPTFERVSFRRGEVIRGRFAPDGKTVLYSARFSGAPDTYNIREDYPESTPAGLGGAIVLSISRQGQMAVLMRPQYFSHYQWSGTLAVSPLGGSAPRELLENVYDADWSPDGNDMAIIDGVNNRWRLQYPMGKVLLEGENWMSDVRVSPDGKQVALFRHPPNTDDRGDVILVDRAGHVQVLSTGWESLEGLAWAPSGKEVWFSSAYSGEQYCIHAVSLSAKERLLYCGTAPTRILDIAQSGRVLVSTEESRGSMAVVEHGPNTVERDLSWLSYSYGPRLSRDGSEMLFSDLSEQGGNEYSVYVRKTDGSPAVRIGGGGFGTDISPDGKWALIMMPSDATGRLQLVPVGPGQARVLHWDGFQLRWALWFADGQHILLNASQAGQPEGLYFTDVNGSAPKRVMPAVTDWSTVSPDGRSLSTTHNGAWVILSIDGKAKPIPGMQPGEFPVAWAEDSKHVFTQTIIPTGLTINKVDVESGKRELWRVVTPKDQVGLRPMVTPTAITPDGRWMAFTYRTQLGQLYRSDTLK